MFDKLFERLADLAEWFVPFSVVDEYEEGVVLRFGRFTRVLGPGFHWIWPFGVDRVITDNVVWRTNDLQVQSLVTKDGRTITVCAVITSRIRNIQKALLDVEGVDDALIDACAGAVGAYVSSRTWEELTDTRVPDELATACQKGATRYGIEIGRVQLKDLTPSRAIRLLQM